MTWIWASEKCWNFADGGLDVDRAIFGRGDGLEPHEDGPEIGELCVGHGLHFLSAGRDVLVRPQQGPDVGG